MNLPWGNTVISGVTERHLDIFQPIGLTFANSPNLDSLELSSHLQYFADSLSVDRNCLKFQKQIHGDTIAFINKDSIQPESDGMITNQKGVILCVLVADCCGILLYDQDNKAVGALHSGWKGTYLNIAAKGVNTMVQNFGTIPELLKAYLSPCASEHNYQVRKDVAELFPTAVVQISEEYYLFNNRLRIKEQLLESGLKAENITISSECTISNTNYHSYRRDGAKSGRSCVYIGLQQ
ncbi:MAG: peptidoglycan editing factor PgeF [Ignavibacteria bacterium]|nr:peptidoglycan editing factor PgeF [Ignavibacteria bacterium]